MDNITLVNRYVLEDLITRLAHECASINLRARFNSCKECPYYSVCHSMNELEIKINFEDPFEGTICTPEQLERDKGAD